MKKILIVCLTLITCTSIASADSLPKETPANHLYDPDHYVEKDVLKAIKTFNDHHPDKRLTVAIGNSLIDTDVARKEWRLDDKDILLAIDPHDANDTYSYRLNSPQKINIELFEKPSKNVSKDVTTAINTLDHKLTDDNDDDRAIAICFMLLLLLMATEIMNINL